MQRLLLIDDDEELGEMLAEYLAPEGYAIDLAFTGETGLQKVLEGGFRLIILDVMLPDRDGFDVLREIRRKSHIPLIMLTTRVSVSDRVTGLEAGADDYVPKPFTSEELLARIRTVLRRGQPSQTETSYLSIDDLILDAGARKVQRAGETIDCTTAEFDVLHRLLSSAGRVVPRDDLTLAALARPTYYRDRGIDNLVSSLRKKLGPSLSGKDRFRSARNAGYIYIRETSSELERSNR
jgi:two-component system response regulator CpxR